MSREETHLRAAGVPVVRLVGPHDLIWALAMGWRDFRAAPACGLAVSAIFVAGGLALLWLSGLAGQVRISLIAAAGFPLLAPFAAVGLYEVSRRIERREPATLARVIAAVLRQKDRQVPLMAAVMVVVFLIWAILAGLILARLAPDAPLDAGQTGLGAVRAAVVAPGGRLLLAAGLVLGAVLAGLVFTLTVVSLPLMLDREVDAATAMITSLSTCLANPGTMLIWGALCAGLLFLGMIPALLGLLVVVPVLGHASWHLYRRALEPEPRPIRTARATSSDVRG